MSVPVEIEPILVRGDLDRLRRPTRRPDLEPSEPTRVAEEDKGAGSAKARRGQGFPPVEEIFVTLGAGADEPVDEEERESELQHFGGGALVHRKSELEGVSHRYDPMRVEALHREMAAIEPTRSGVLGYVSEHGWLGAQLVAVLPAKELEARRRESSSGLWSATSGICVGERLRDWQYHVAKLDALVRLLEWKGGNDVARLVRDQRRRDDGGEKGELPELASLRRSLRKMLERDRREAEGDAMTLISFDGRRYEDCPYRLHRRIELNPWDGDHEAALRYSALLDQDLSRELERGVYPVVGESGIQLAPRSLAGAAYLSLAVERSRKGANPGDGGPWRFCANCGKRFDSTDPRKMYCKPGCKVTASRRRRAAGLDATEGSKGTEEDAE